METLQEKVDEIPSKVEEVKNEIKPLSYQGLTLVESGNYSGGTSVKYWM